MTSHPEQRYTEFKSPEVRTELAQRAGSAEHNLDARVAAAYENLKKRKERESYGKGEKRKEEVLGNFQKSCLTIRGLRGRAYAGAMRDVRNDEDKIEERQNNINQIRQDKALYEEALKEIRGTTSWWRVDQKAKLGYLRAKETVVAGVKEGYQQGMKKLWEIGKSMDEWVADVMKGDIDSLYKRAIHDLESTKKMESLIFRFYSKSLVAVSVKELSDITADDDKKTLLGNLKTTDENVFKNAWDKLRKTLSNEEYEKLISLLSSRLDGKERRMVKRLQKQIDAIYARPDVHDYQEVMYLKDVQKNMSDGKKLYNNINPKAGTKVPAWHSILRSLFDQSPNVAYMLCDAADHYKGTGESLESVLQKLLLEDKTKNKNTAFVEKLEKISGEGNVKSVNDLIKINFYVKNELDENRNKILGELRNIKWDALLSQTIPEKVNVQSDFLSVPVMGRNIIDIAYDVREILERKGVRNNKNAIALKIALILHKSDSERLKDKDKTPYQQMNRVDPKYIMEFNKLKESDKNEWKRYFNDLPKAA